MVSWVAPKRNFFLGGGILTRPTAALPIRRLPSTAGVGGPRETADLDSSREYRTAQRGRSIGSALARFALEHYFACFCGSLVKRADALLLPGKLNGDCGGHFRVGLGRRELPEAVMKKAGADGNVSPAPSGVERLDATAAEGYD